MTNLKELKLIDCKISSWITKQIVEQLHFKCNLKSIAIVHCNMTDSTFKLLVSALPQAKILRQLDLSWCERNFKDFDSFYKILPSLQLTHLNLSWNSLFDPKQGKDQLGIKALCQLVKQNVLLHLDLSHTELQDDMMLELIYAMKESESLQAVHLDGNPANSKQMYQQVASILDTQLVKSN